MKVIGKLILAAAVLVPSVGYGYDCNSDCGLIASFNYPCPTFRKPGRKCQGRNPATYLTCESAKAVSCKLWQSAVDYAEPRMKPFLIGEFNAEKWKMAEENGTTDVYMAYCTAAGIGACSALGAELGGPWGAALSGSIGTFVSWKVCDQSKKW
jgi:hypothetical protein